MLFCVVKCSNVLCCAVLPCVVLFCFVLQSVAVCCALLCCSMLRCAVLHSAVVCYAVLCFAVLFLFCGELTVQYQIHCSYCYMLLFRGDGCSGTYFDLLQYYIDHGLVIDR